MMRDETVEKNQRPTQKQPGYFQESMGFWEGIVDQAWETIAKMKTKTNQEVVSIHPNERS